MNLESVLVTSAISIQKMANLAIVESLEGGCDTNHLCSFLLSRIFMCFGDQSETRATRAALKER